MEQDLDQVSNIEIGTLREFKAKSERKISDLLNELKLSGKFFAILIDGKKASLDSVVKPGQSIVLLPKIAGG